MYPNFALLFLLNANNEVLLLRRINTPFGNNCYSLPGRQIESGETATQAAVREAAHSIGITLDPEILNCVHVMHRKCNDPEFFAAVFKPQAWEGMPTNQEPTRHDDLRWFPLDALPENIVPAHAHAIQQILQNKQYSEHGFDLYTKNSQPSYTQSDCIFCQRAHDAKTAFVAKFKHCYVVKDNYPVSPGHMLIIPYQHCCDWFSADREVQMDITQALQEMKTKLEAELHPDGYNIGMNCGVAAGQTVMHLHVHLIPRYTGDMENPRGGVRGVIPAKQKY